MSFIFTKTENRKAKPIFPRREAGSGIGESIRKECRRVNMVELLCTHVCK
jgi:hypothetical protein